MYAPTRAIMAVSLLLLTGCGGAEGESSGVGSEAAASVAGPDLSTNAAVCAFVSETPKHQPDAELLWAQVNTGAALEEVLAIGWQPGSFNSRTDGELLQAEQLYKTLPAAQEIVRLRPGMDKVSVTFTGTNLDAARKTIFLLPASVVAAYADTPEGRNAVQDNVQVLDELPPSSGPNGLEVTDADGSLLPQC